MPSSWRDRAAPIIAEVIRTVGKGDLKRLRAALRAAYPFGPRENHPYKIWRSEVRRQIGTQHKPDPRQPELFG
jgi:lauroyl/myristoyl acyltransferase